MPILLLSARGEVRERVDGLNAGADDYLPKPFALAERVAGVRALGRRGTESRATVLQVADPTLDTLTREARRGATAIELRARECRLLECLRQSAGRVRGRMSILEEVLSIFLRVGIPAMLMALGGGWWLMRRALAPVEALTAAVERTNDRNLQERLPRTGNGDEIDRLTEVFNAMTARLDESFHRIRDFTLHASHELKTPLTVMQGEIETACRDEALTDEQRNLLLSQLDEVQRLAKIVDNLSLLTKADAGQVALLLEPVQLEDLVRETVEDLQHLGQGQVLEVVLEVCEAVAVVGDRHRLRQMLLNLADNSVKYNAPGGRVSVSLRRVGPHAEMAISNTGPGVPPELQARVFERFFRGDASHSPAVEGSGLGLSIAQWIVEAHRGSVRLDSDIGGLTTVTVRLPAEPA